MTSVRFSSRPAYVSLSRVVMCQLGCWLCAQRTKLDPMKPAPPVTRTLMRSDATAPTLSPERAHRIREGADAGQREGEIEPAVGLEADAQVRDVNDLVIDRESD